MWLRVALATALCYCAHSDELGWYWSLVEQGWLWLGLPPLRLLSGPSQHFRDSVWDAWLFKVAGYLGAAFAGVVWSM